MALHLFLYIIYDCNYGADLLAVLGYGVARFLLDSRPKVVLPAVKATDLLLHRHRYYNDMALSALLEIGSLKGFIS